MKNILFIGIFHETNCFIKEKTKLKDFEILKFFFEFYQFATRR